MKRIKEAKEDYALNINTVERWQNNAGWKNRKLIKAWADAKRELETAEEQLKARKGEIAEELQEAKNNGEKITDKMLAHLIDVDEDVINLRRDRNSIQVDIDELEKMMLLYRDMWNSSVSVRQSVNVAERSSD